MENFYDFSDDMFSASQKIDFHGFKNGAHKFRILPPYAPGKLFLQVDLHWGYTDENGRKKALKCTKYSHKTCAICDEVDRIKSEVELLKATPAATPDAIETLKKQIEDKEKRVSDIKKKATYLWNIMTEDGSQKVLQLSWNGHDPLHQKVKFYWEQKKINVTNPAANYLMYVERSGMNAKTRYAYEVLDQNVRALENLKPLIDLSKVYKETTPAEIKKVVDSGFVGLPEADPNDRDFTASIPAGIPEANKATPAPQATVAASIATVGNNQGNATAAPTENAIVNSAALTQNNQTVVDDATENLMRMLNT